MVFWTKYSLAPDPKRETAFYDYVERLAEERSLFFIMTHILKAARYATVVIMIDQAEKLVVYPSLTNELTNICNRESGADRDRMPDAKLNLFFVFAGTTEVLQLRSATDQGGFVRRFLDFDQWTIDADLVTPIIDCSPGNDIDRIVNVLNELKEKFQGLPIPEFTVERVRKVRRDLAKKGSVTWSTLWKSMLNDQVN
jgi:hypothetical protein